MGGEGGGGSSSILTSNSPMPCTILHKTEEGREGWEGRRVGGREGGMEGGLEGGRDRRGGRWVRMNKENKERRNHATLHTY